MEMLSTPYAHVLRSPGHDLDVICLHLLNRCEFYSKYKKSQGVSNDNFFFKKWMIWQDILLFNSHDLSNSFWRMESLQNILVTQTDGKWNQFTHWKMKSWSLAVKLCISSTI